MRKPLPEERFWMLPSCLSVCGNVLDKWALKGVNLVGSTAVTFWACLPLLKSLIFQKIRILYSAQIFEFPCVMKGSEGMEDVRGPQLYRHLQCWWEAGLLESHGVQHGTVAAQWKSAGRCQCSEHFPVTLSKRQIQPRCFISRELHAIETSFCSWRDLGLHTPLSDRYMTCIKNA